MPRFNAPEYISTSQSICTLLMIEDVQDRIEYLVFSKALLSNIRSAYETNKYDLETLEDYLLDAEQAYYEYLHGWETIKDPELKNKIKVHFDNEDNLIKGNNHNIPVIKSTVFLLLQSEIDFNSDEYKSNRDKIEKHLLAITMLYDFDINALNMSLVHHKPKLKSVI